MSDIPRRSIEDLILMYELEPTLKDVYVEGYFDRDVITSCFEHANITNRIVYVIESVDIPYSVLEKHGLTEGCKQRVIALAKELSDISHAKCKFLVDRDIDHWLGNLDDCLNLVWTRYSSLELYFFSIPLLKKIIISVSQTKIENFDRFFDSFSSALIYLYSARLADYELKLNFKWPDIDKDVKIVNGTVVFDSSSYINRVLSRNSRVQCRDTFESSIDKWRNTCFGKDFRLSIRGHDFVNLLALVIKNGKGYTSLGSPEAIERTFVLISDSDLEIYSDLMVA